ncbi:hypothetical protein L1887_31542 [Cichorium endivia]|nr:hypothetical protein L1887_31542 [Cichorium endivia]
MPHLAAVWWSMVVRRTTSNGMDLGLAPTSTGVSGVDLGLASHEIERRFCHRRNRLVLMTPTPPTAVLTPLVQISTEVTHVLFFIVDRETCNRHDWKVQHIFEACGSDEVVGSGAVGPGVVGSGEWEVDQVARWEVWLEWVRVKLKMGGTLGGRVAGKDAWFRSRLELVFEYGCNHGTLFSPKSSSRFSPAMSTEGSSHSSIIHTLSITTPSLTLVQFPSSLKLLSTNYMSLKTQIKALLYGLNLYKFIDGTYPAPQPTVSADGTSTPYKDYLSCFRQDRLLFGAIVGTLSPFVPLITTAPSSLEAWKILSNTYAKPSRGHVKQLQHRLKQTTKHLINPSLNTCNPLKP